MSSPDDEALRFDAIESRLTAHVSERMLELAGLRAGMSVLDLASGMGEPALRAAQWVGASGRVVGIDVSAAALEIARAKARAAGLANVDFQTLDAADFSSEGEPFDIVTARWGLMSMSAPVRALAAARRALATDGRIVAALWAERERIPWWDVPHRVTARHAALPDVDPEAPGALRYATLDRIERDFAAAGLTIEHVEELEVPVIEAGTSVGLVAWVRHIFTRWVEAIPPTRMPAWERELSDELESFRRGETLQLGGLTRLVVARRPGR